MMNLLRRWRPAVKLSLGFRPFRNLSSPYDLTDFTKQYNHLINNNDTPLLVNHRNGSFQMLTSTWLRSGHHAIIKTPPVSVQFPKDFFVCGPCDGLFCLYSADGEVVLWNPGTGDTKSLTGDDLHRDQKIKTRNVGFGFDSKANDYKIVRSITRFFINPSYNSVEEMIDQVEIYSLKTKQWRELSFPGEHSNSDLPLLTPGSFADGACYWTSEQDPKKLDGDNKEIVRLISFDFEEEVFHLHALHPPAGSLYSSRSCKMDTLDGCPAALLHNACDVQVWKGMRESAGVVTWDFEVTLGSLDRLRKLIPLCFWKNEGLILMGNTCMLYWYEFERKWIYHTHVYLELEACRLMRRDKRIQLLNFPEFLVPNVW